MKVTNVLILISSLTLTSFAFAEGGGDRTFDRMEKARAVAMAAHEASTASTVDRDAAQQETKVQKPHC
ncbi:co-regulatory protein PtrA N-terminal domain-containing protein [Pseudomonas sp. EL_65y_Pfl1_R32]|uniref:co-regulatory protein PtrA N-terminal domain-containing protein n=1 Tax=unclassified Pseudomonas TaxID=196821 RepID=UPI00351A2AE6